MHMTSDNFIDANKDTFLLKRVTDASNNTMQLSLDGTNITPLTTNSIPLGQNSVAFVRAHVFGRDYIFYHVHASTFDVVIHTVCLPRKFHHTKHSRNNPPGQESWSVTPDAFTIGSDPFFTFGCNCNHIFHSCCGLALDITLVT